MTTLFILLSCILTGYLLRRKSIPMLPSACVNYLVWLLLFVFGLSVGSNRTVVEQFDRFGMQALTLAAFAALGSAVASWVLWKIVSGRKKP